MERCRSFGSGPWRRQKLQDDGAAVVLDRVKWIFLWTGLLGFTAEAGELETQRFDAEVKLRVGYDYLLAFPDDYEADESRKWPLIVFLHGSGERGDDVQKVKVHGPLKRLEEGQRIDAIIAAPQAKPGSIWDPHAVKALTDELAKTHRVDNNRIYLTGLSMGGFGTWDTALEYPETYAAIAPICGGAGVRFIMAERLQSLPIWIFHGDADTAVPVEHSLKMEKALKKVGNEVKLTIYEGVGHDSWTRTYENPAFWEWLFAQKRGGS